jgi:hypothetical protein
MHAASEIELDVRETHGFFNVMDPGWGFELHAATLSALRERATETGIATSAQIESLHRELRRATHDRAWVTSPFFLDLALRKPSPN